MALVHLRTQQQLGVAAVGDDSWRGLRGSSSCTQYVHSRRSPEGHWRHPHVQHQEQSSHGALLRRE